MIKLSTEKFKKAVAKAEKGAGKNQLMPITEMIGIKVIDRALYLCTTDKTNDLQVIIKDVESEDVSITVKAETLAKLMSKITSDTTTLEITDDNLLVKANGNYKIPLEVDENGNIDFPSIKFDKAYKKEFEVDINAVKNILNINKASLAVTYDNPFLTGYLIGDNTITCNGGEGCITFNGNKFSDIGEKILVNPNMMTLLGMCGQEKIKIIKDGSQLYLYSNDMIICGKELDGKEDYPADEMSVYLEEKFPSSCKVTKSLLLGVLDRLQIFIQPYDENGAVFTFTEKALQIQSKTSNSVEEIMYTESTNAEPFNCLVDIPMFKEQLNANPADVVEIHFGLDNAIKMTYGKITQVISLLEDNNESE